MRQILQKLGDTALRLMLTIESDKNHHNWLPYQKGKKLELCKIKKNITEIKSAIW